MVKIYTKTGDKGQTSLFGGKRVSKANIRVEAYGTVDELNSVIGVAITEISNIPASSAGRKYQISNKEKILKIKKELINIQNDLIEIGAILAQPLNYSSSDPELVEGESRSNNSSNSSRRARTIKNLSKRVRDFEEFIDELTIELPKLRNFILPGGGKVGSLLHFARTICRRAERRIVELSRKEKVDEEILQYFNRLSDLLFTMARFMNHKEKQKEIIWSKNK